jgi:hypothetical protein
VAQNKREETSRQVTPELLTGTSVSRKIPDVRGVDLLEFVGGKITGKDSFWKIVE